MKEQAEAGSGNPQANGSETSADAFWNQDRVWTEIFRSAEHQYSQIETASLPFADIFHDFEYYNSNGSIANTIGTRP